MKLARRQNGALVGRRDFGRSPMTYNRIANAYGDGLWWVLKTLAKVCIGLFALALLAGVGLLFYAIAS